MPAKFLSCLSGLALCLFLSALCLAEDSDSPVFQCAEANGETLYTNNDRPGCQAVALGSLTIAPSRFHQQNTLAYNPLRPFPEDWFEYSDPVGSLRNRMANGGLYGMQHWIDYDAPVGSMRNSVTTWPSPYGLYGW